VNNQPPLGVNLQSKLGGAIHLWGFGVYGFLGFIIIKMVRRMSRTRRRRTLGRRRRTRRTSRRRGMRPDGIMKEKVSFTFPIIAADADKAFLNIHMVDTVHSYAPNESNVNIRSFN